VAIGAAIAALALPTGLWASTPPQDGPKAAPASTKHEPCATWRVRTLLSGQGWLENLGFDGRGSLTLSALGQGRLLRLSRSGRLSTLLEPVSGPGGQARRGRFLYFNTGDLPTSAPTGTIDRLDLRTGVRSTWSSGLTMPNGLIFLPNGDAVVSRDLGSGTGLTRVPATDPAHPQFAWAQLDDTNGLAVDPSGRWLYVDRTFSPDGEVDRVLISDPRRVEVVGRLGPGVVPDDMTIDRRGILYIAGFVSGNIYRLDPGTHTSCPIASGLEQPTSARFGEHGWHKHHLYVTDAGGHLSELIPPHGRG
jgi:SMP-30/Gluconolactonase/LRE-like region